MTLYERIQAALKRRGFGYGKTWNLASKPEVIKALEEVVEAVLLIRRSSYRWLRKDWKKVPLLRFSLKSR